MVSTGTRVISYWFESERNRIRAEKEKSVAELSALKAQINPHFLFNVLNSIYFLSRKKSDATPEVILKLSDLMRFLLTETTAGYIPLEKEVESIRQYIDLQKLRLTEKTKIIFETIGEAGNLSIAPLLLLPFVENAFKYGVSSHRHSEIMISLTMMQDRLMFMVKNGKAGTPVSEKSTGTGLKNVVRRLNLTYPDKHALKIGETETGYVVELKIILT
jgi:LytS/YehU family sensor histidine kinase